MLLPLFLPVALLYSVHRQPDVQTKFGTFINLLSPSQGPGDRPGIPVVLL